MAVKCYTVKFVLHRIFSDQLLYQLLLCLLVQVYHIFLILAGSRVEVLELEALTGARALGA